VGTFSRRITYLSLEGLTSVDDTTLAQAAEHLAQLQELYVSGNSTVTQVGVQLLQFAATLRALGIAWTQGDNGLLPAWPNLTVGVPCVPYRV
jgi:hypothetical protein